MSLLDGDANNTPARFCWRVLLTLSNGNAAEKVVGILLISAPSLPRQSSILGSVVSAAAGGLGLALSYYNPRLFQPAPTNSLNNNHELKIKSNRS